MILVAGATGQLGGAVAQQLLAQSKRVRALVRANSPSKGMAAQGMATAEATLRAAGAEIVYGDLRDRASLDAACQGVQTVISTVTSIARDQDFAHVDIEGTQSLIDAAQAAGAGHFIFVSANGASAGHPVPLYDAKGRVEAYLKQSGLDYTILRPGPFMEIWLAMVAGMPLAAGEPVTLVGQGATRQAFVSAGDVAAYVVAAVDNPHARNRTLEIAGDRPVSFAKAIQAIAQALGREIPIRYVAPGEPVPLLPEGVGAMLAGMERADTLIDMRQTAAEFGIPPTPVETFAERFAAQARSRAQ